MRRIFQYARLFLWVLILDTSPYLPFTASAQVLDSLQASKKQELALHGLSPSQIEEKFGKPDGEEKKSEFSFSWTYGKSAVFFLDGKVSAWSDHGDFTERSKLKELKKASPSPQKADLRDEWVNPWTPGKKTIDTQKPAAELPHE